MDIYHVNVQNHLNEIVSYNFVVLIFLISYVLQNIIDQTQGHLRHYMTISIDKNIKLKYTVMSFFSVFVLYSVIKLLIVFFFTLYCHLRFIFYLHISNVSLVSIRGLVSAFFHSFIYLELLKDYIHLSEM